MEMALLSSYEAEPTANFFCFMDKIYAGHISELSSLIDDVS